MSWGRWVNLICVVKVTGNNVLWVWECTSSRHNVSVHLSKTNQGGSDTMESRSTIFTCSGCGSVHQVDAMLTMLVCTSVEPTGGSHTVESQSTIFMDRTSSRNER